MINQKQLEELVYFVDISYANMMHEDLCHCDR